MEKTKRCPYCGEEILAIAKKCKHCGEWLDETPPLKETKTCPTLENLLLQMQRYVLYAMNLHMFWMKQKLFQILLTQKEQL